MYNQEGMAGLRRAQRAYYDSGATQSAAFRREQLRKLREWIALNEKPVQEALRADLGKSFREAKLTEIAVTQGEIDYALHHISAWMRPKRVRTELFQFPSRGRVIRDPYGCALILSPWNYPFMLSVCPLTAAIAGGNCAMLKPSAYSPHTSALLAQMARECFSPEYITVVEGGREEIAGLLDEPFDKIFFTGSVAVGKVVMEAASKHLTPVTLELGGKSPCIVDETAHIDRAAKRIVWGKFLNAGQTCIAPDYLLVHESVCEKLTERMTKYISSFYGDYPEMNESFPHIINDGHYARLMALLGDTTLICGGQGDPKSRRIAPTLVSLSDWSHPLMREEIFGPILPIFAYSSLEDILDKIRSLPKPLALYLFSREDAVQRRVMEGVAFGGGCVNDTILHIANPRMPFGGVGTSGMGQYHGKYGFETFTRPKSVLYKGGFDLPVRYPPYKD